MKTIVVLAEAAEDIEAAREFYEQSEAGVGGHFVDSLLADLASLGEVSGVHSVHFGFYPHARGPLSLRHLLSAARKRNAGCGRP